MDKRLKLTVFVFRFFLRWVVADIRGADNYTIEFGKDIQLALDKLCKKKGVL